MNRTNRAPLLDTEPQPQRASAAGSLGKRVAAALALPLGLVLATTSGLAHATVLQTDAERTPLPQPVGTAELGLGEIWGYAAATASFRDPMTGEPLPTPILYGEYYSPPAFPQFEDGDAFTFEGLFKWRGESIDPIADASTRPGHFLPGCEVKAELVLHGGDCDVALGWYNYDSNGPPSPNDIHVLVPKGSTYLNAKRFNLVPTAWGNRDPRDLSQTLWTPRVFSTGDLAANPDYAGGDIAFVMLGGASFDCPTNKFAAYEHNPNNAAGVPWVTALTYRSKAHPDAVYLAFEDLPMSPQSWRSTGAQLVNDGDFNDAVFFVSGLGAGASCPNSPGDGGSGVGAGGSDAEFTAGAAGADLVASAGAATDDTGGVGGIGGVGGAANQPTPEEASPTNGGAPEDNRGGEPNGHANPSGGNGARESSSCACRLQTHGPSALPQIIALGLALGATYARRRRRTNQRASTVA